jgi:hypothetical protein
MPAMAGHRLAVAVLLLVSSGMSAKAGLVGPIDGFEFGNRGQWAASGATVLSQAPPAGQKGVLPHGGKNFVILSNDLPFPGTALTTSVTVDAPKGSPCTLEIWAQATGKTGALLISVRNGFATGKSLAEKHIAAPMTSRAKGASGYTRQRLNFRHPGAPLFVTLGAIGPIQIALDDFSLRCRTK